MSDPPPPASPQPAPEPALPPAPKWVPPAVPVQSLEYTLPSRGSRPGILTAIGVLSICIAGLSGLYGLFSGLQGITFYFASMAAARATATATATVAGTAPPTIGVAPAAATAPSTSPAGATGGPGMRPAERKAAIEALTKDDPLAPRRQQQLDAILAAVGNNLGTDAVTDRGTMPDSRAGEAGAEYFITRRGRLEIFDDRAVFFPFDGSPTVRVSAPPQDTAAPSAGGDNDLAATNHVVGPGGLTQAEIQAVVQQVDTLAKQSGGTGPNTQQVATIQALLSMPGQQLVAPGAWGGVGYCYIDKSGQLTITFNSGSMLILGAQGNVITQTSPVAFGGAPMFTISPWAVAMYIATTVLSLGLAVLLLVAGIMVLRQSPSGRRLHLIYAVLKIPVALAAGLSFAYAMHQMMSGFAAAGAPTGVGWGVSLWAAVPAALGCLYPVALLIALNTRTVREYYHSVAEG